MVWDRQVCHAGYGRRVSGGLVGHIMERQGAPESGVAYPDVNGLWAGKAGGPAARDVALTATGLIA